MSVLAALDAPLATLLDESRRAVLATLREDGRPRLVPITYAADLRSGVLYSALDYKPKSVADPRQLARVRDIVARPRVSVLVDHWSEDWSELTWLRLDGSAGLLEPDDADRAIEHAAAVTLLRARYAQYADQPIEQRPLLRIEVDSARGWTAR